MSARRNRDAIVHLYEAINRHDFEGVAEIPAEEVFTHNIPEHLGQGREAYLRFLQALLKAFPDFRAELLNVVADDEMAAARFRNTGTQEGEFMGIPASGRSISLEGSAFYRFDPDGKVVEQWRYQDGLALSQQLGAHS